MEPKQSRAPKPRPMPSLKPPKAMKPPARLSSKPITSPGVIFRPSRTTSIAMPITGMVAEMTATVTALVMPCPSSNMKAPSPMVPPPINNPLSQLALVSASRPSSHHHSGSKHAAAMTMRAAFKGRGGTTSISRSAAGRPMAQISIESMHMILADWVLDGAGRAFMYFRAGSLERVKREAAVS